jgi:hypothetical protein
MVFDFALMGLVGLPSDVSVPSITYATVQPPKCESIGLTIGAWSPVVRSLGFKKNVARSPRADVNSAGHRGFAMGRRAPELEIVVEAAALATFDPYTARRNATSFAVGFTVGDTQYNRIEFGAAQAQVTGVQEGEDAEAALWTLTLRCPVSGLAANDDYFIRFT